MRALFATVTLLTACSTQVTDSGTVSESVCAGSGAYVVHTECRAVLVDGRRITITDVVVRGDSVVLDQLSGWHRVE